MNKWVHLKSRLENTGTWSIAAWPSRLLCYRPTLFFRHLIAFLLPARKSSACIYNTFCNDLSVARVLQGTPRLRLLLLLLQHVLLFQFFTFLKKYIWKFLTWNWVSRGECLFWKINLKMYNNVGFTDSCIFTCRLAKWNTNNNGGHTRTELRGGLPCSLVLSKGVRR